MLRSAPTLVNDSFAAIAPDAERSLQASAKAVAAVLDERGGRPLLLESVSPVLVPVLRRTDARCNGLVVNWGTNPRLELSGDWEQYLSRLSKSQRADVRRLVRRGAGMRFRSVRLADEVAAATRLSLGQRRRVWAESGMADKMSAFQREPAWDDFLVDAAGALAGSGLASVDELVRDDDVVASVLWLERGTDASGLSPERRAQPDELWPDIGGPVRTGRHRSRSADRGVGPGLGGVEVPPGGERRCHLRRHCRPRPARHFGRLGGPSHTLPGSPYCAPGWKLGTKRMAPAATAHTTTDNARSVPSVGHRARWVAGRLSVQGWVTALVDR